MVGMPPTDIYLYIHTYARNPNPPFTIHVISEVMMQVAATTQPLVQLLLWLLSIVLTAQTRCSFTSHDHRIASILK